MHRLLICCSLLLAMLATALADLPVAAQDDAAASREAREARLGGTRGSFEKRYGEPSSVDGDCKSDGGCFAVYAIDGVDRAQVIFAKDKALWIQLHGRQGAFWDDEAAYARGAEFLPTDAELDPRLAYPNAAGGLVSPCRSESLIKAFNRAMYDAANATGERGDCQLIFTYDAGAVAIVDVQLGDGPFPAGLERPEAPLTEDELAYLERTDNVLMTALESISRFRAGISANPPDTNRIADAVVFWQATLPGMLEAAPAGVLDGFYEQYVEVAALLAVVGTDVTAVINGDSARIDAVTRNLSAAEQQLANLRDAVAAYGSIQASDAVSSGGGSDAELSSAEEDYLRAAAELVSEFLQGAAAVRDELAEAEPDDSVIESAVRSWGSLADRADELTAPSDALAGFHTRFRDAFANLRGDPARLILVRIAAGELDAIAGPLEELEAPVLALQEELAGYLPG